MIFLNLIRRFCWALNHAKTTAVCSAADPGKATLTGALFRFSLWHRSADATRLRLVNKANVVVKMRIAHEKYLIEMRGRLSRTYCVHLMRS